MSIYVNTVKIQMWTVEIDRGEGRDKRYVNPCQHIDKEGLEKYAREYSILYKPNVARVIPYKKRKE